MLKKLSNLPFTGTAEQEARLMAFIEKNKHDKSMLMAVMQEAQEIHGYLPIEVKEAISLGQSVINFTCSFKFEFNCGVKCFARILLS